MSITADLLQWPGVFVSDDQDVSFAISLEDSSDLTGASLKLTIREDPRWPDRPQQENVLRNLTDNPTDDPAGWTSVVTSTSQTGSPPSAVTVLRASMAALSPGRYRYVIEVSRTDSGNVSPVVPPTWLSVRAGVSR